MIISCCTTVSFRVDSMGAQADGGSRTISNHQGTISSLENRQDASLRGATVKDALQVVTSQAKESKSGLPIAHPVQNAFAITNSRSQLELICNWKSTEMLCFGKTQTFKWALGATKQQKSITQGTTSKKKKNKKTRTHPHSVKPCLAPLWLSFWLV